MSNSALLQIGMRYRESMKAGSVCMIQALKAHSNNFCPLSPNSKLFSLIEKNDKGAAEVRILAAIST